MIEDTFWVLSECVELGPCPGTSTMPDPAEQSADVNLPPKRSHKKSRLGCTNCKLRKVKCDETRPACRSCRIRRTKCEYAPVASRKSPASSPSKDYPATSTALSERIAMEPRIVHEPLICLPTTDAVDMRLLWFYTSSTCKSLSYVDDTQRPINDMLQTVLVEHAFEAPFLMNSILELASLHMQSLGQATEPTRALVYQARSVEGYRRAIEAAQPSTYGALLANSVLRPILSTQSFGEVSSNHLHILDWMLLWRGVESIINITSASSIKTTGMAPLFSRPPMDLTASTAAIPKDLLLMISFVERDDPDFAELQAYQNGLRALGCLFDSLGRGIDSVMLLRIITWGTGAVNGIVDLARARRPRALVIIAHYACFLKLLQGVWWLAGFGQQSLKAICHELGPEWQSFLSIPLSAMQVDDHSDLCSILLGAVNR